MLESYPMLTSVCTIALSGYHAVMLNTSKSAIENTNLHHEFARVLLTLLLHVILTHAHERARAHAQVSNVKTGVGIGRKCFRVGVSMYVCVRVCVDLLWISSAFLRVCIITCLFANGRNTSRFLQKISIHLHKYRLQGLIT